MSRGITLAKAISVFEGELGCGNSREFLIDIIQTSIEYMLFSGGGEILREWQVPVRNGVFTFPRDLETPVKYRCGRTASQGYGTFNSAYYQYSSQSIQNCCDYGDFDSLRLNIRPNKTPTQFQPPKKGVRVLATTRECKDVGKKIMVGGNRCKNPILPLHNGYKTSGELLTIYAEDDNNKKYSAYIFDEITSVVKDETCGYVMLSGLETNYNEFYFLSHYTPDETSPMYTQGALHYCVCGGNCSGGCDFNLHILGRISPSILYIRDEDILPISSFEILRLLAKRARFDESSNFNEVANIEARIEKIIRKQVAYQQASTRQFSFSLAGSGATLSNI